MIGTVAENIARVRERIEAAAECAGRRSDEITLVAVTKLQPVSAISAALASGLADIGENYVQEALAKRELLRPSEIGIAHWHLQGHLQSNKVKQAVGAFDLIQGVDSLPLAGRISRQAQTLGKLQAILIQVHLGDEETKSGLAIRETLDTVAQALELEGLDVQGLMGIAPHAGDPRPHFAALRRLFDRLPPGNSRILSMGMTGDFETAIEEGATMVRIGTAIFGARN